MYLQFIFIKLGISLIYSKFEDILIKLALF
jgi:hypothetical protein